MSGDPFARPDVVGLIKLFGSPVVSIGRILVGIMDATLKSGI